MSVTVHYECNGCFAKAEGTEPLRVEFMSVSGRSYGIGSFRPANSATSVAPEGWWAFDPYTCLCYCPECRAKIEKGDDDG
jgi:hypothetical protein